MACDDEWMGSVTTVSRVGFRFAALEGKVSAATIPILISTRIAMRCNDSNNGNNTIVIKQ